jgi:hypothetical protein
MNKDSIYLHQDMPRVKRKTSILIGQQEIKGAPFANQENINKREELKQVDCTCSIPPNPFCKQ